MNLKLNLTLYPSLLLKLQLFVFAVEEVGIKSLVRSTSVTKCTRMFFRKTNKANQTHGAKKVFKSVFWVKVFRKFFSCKKHYFSFLIKGNSIAFLHKCKDYRHCRNNKLLLIKIKISIRINKVSVS